MTPTSSAPGSDRAAPGEVVVRALQTDLPLVLFFVGDLTDAVSTTIVASFQDHLDAFAQHGVGVQGIVRAPASEVAEFLALHGLRVQLASDEHGDVARTLGLDPQAVAGTTVVLYELVVRATVLDHVAASAQPDAALAAIERNQGRP